MLKQIPLMALLVALTFAVACGEEENAAPEGPSNEEAMAATAEEFLAAFGQGDAEASFGLLSPAAQEQIGGLEAWKGHIAEGAEYETLPSDWNFTSQNASDTAGQIQGTVVTKGEKQLGITLEKTDAGWVVAGFSFK